MASAAEIRWTATGSVESVSGTGFSAAGVSAEDVVEVEMTYDSNAVVQGRSFLNFGSFVAGRTWFTGGANLEIRVSIGENTWRGSLPNIPTSTDVMESLCYDPRGGAERFTVTLDAARGGTFPEFPFSGDPSAPSLSLEFRDDETTTTNLFEVQVIPDNLSQVGEMTSATGAIQDGASSISFNMDPASVRITLPPVPATIAKVENGIQLSWDTEVGTSYRVEGSSDLKIWSIEGFYAGTGSPQQPIFNPFDIYPRRFYRVVEQ